jgi:hypothetical protein
MTRAEMMERMSSRELSEWQLFAKSEPFGSEADYIGHAITAQTIANVNRPEGQSPYEIDDFMPKFDDTGNEMTPEEQTQYFVMLAEAFGGQVVISG